MTTRCWQIAVATLALLPQIIGCADKEATGTEDSITSAEQACLLTHTTSGAFNFSGTQQQVCGVGRHDFTATVAAGSSIVLPAAKFGLSLNFSLVAVRLTSSEGGYIELTQTASGSACGSTQSWQFDNDLKPSKIVLCNCGSNQQSDGSVYVDLLVGCGNSTSTGGAGYGTSTGTGGGTSTSTCTTGQYGSTNTCTTGQYGSTNTGTTGQGGSTNTGTTGQCGTTNTYTIGQSGTTNTYTIGQYGSTSTGTTGNCGSTSTCTTGNCGSTSTCTTGNCGSTSTCTTGNCGSTSTCTTGNCGSTSTQSDDGIQIDGRIEIGVGSSTVVVDIDVSTSGCSCLWNIVFEDGGCTADN